ncbi:MAG: FAD-binding protein, partial [Desulfofustis sp.]
RSIDHEMKEKGDDYVFLDISHKDASFIRKRFPGIYNQCREYGIDITREPIPVVPAAHYLCGGVLVDSWANTTLAGLMAIGETSCTGLHGANRLASNSLLEAVVFDERAARYCAENNALIGARGQGRGAESQHDLTAVELDENVLINHNWDVLRRTMWNYVGIVRNSKRLVLAQQRVIAITREIESLYAAHRFSRNMVELRNIAHVALMIIESALQRKESRGLHYTTDYPEPVESQRRWTVLEKEKGMEPWEFSVRHQEFSHSA